MHCSDTPQNSCFWLTGYFIGFLTFSWMCIWRTAFFIQLLLKLSSWDSAMNYMRRANMGGKKNHRLRMCAAQFCDSRTILIENSTSLISSKWITSGYNQYPPGQSSITFDQLLSSVAITALCLIFWLDNKFLFAFSKFRISAEPKHFFPLQLTLLLMWSASF